MPWYVVLYLHSTSDHNRISMPTLCVCSCIIPSFYIKPQLLFTTIANNHRCIIPSFYIKPQLKGLKSLPWPRCIIPSFYIKPQPNLYAGLSSRVVLYLHSTSNHNIQQVVSYVNQLYYTFILHQTTTAAAAQIVARMLYYTFILHQTTTQWHYTCS